MKMGRVRKMEYNTKRCFGINGIYLLISVFTLYFTYKERKNIKVQNIFKIKMFRLSHTRMNNFIFKLFFSLKTKNKNVPDYLILE